MSTVAWTNQYGQPLAYPVASAAPSGHNSRGIMVANPRNQANRWGVQGLSPGQGGSAVSALTAQFGAMAPFGRRKSRRNMRKRNQRKRKTSRK